MADRRVDRRFDVTRWPGRDEVLTLRDGRRVSLRHFGDEAGQPLVMLHGTPGSRILFAAMDTPARVRGVHVIALDRWAYGGTDAPSVPSLTLFADDVAAVMTAMQIGAFSIAGVSGGGPFAAGVAVHFAERVKAVGLISPVGLVRAASDHGEVDAFHRFCFHHLPKAPRAIGAMFSGYAKAVRFSAGLACGLTTARAPAADKAIMADCATSDRLLAAFNEGLRVSGRGPAIDLKLFQEIDQLDLARARMPAHVWIGSEDRNVPPAAARRLAGSLPNAALTELAGAGHLWIAQNYDVVLDWVCRGA
jgi:pimeloyl-ACP methyl ester carboxylesterase